MINGQPYLPPLSPPWYVAATGVVALVLIVFGSIERNRATSINNGHLAQLCVELGTFFLVLFSAGVFFSSAVTFAEFYIPWLFMSPWASVGAVAIGCGLYALRRRRLAIYAVIEIAGALSAAAVCGFTHYGTVFQRGIALLTAIYFLIRGLDNAEKGQLWPKMRKRWQQGLVALVGIVLTLIAVFIASLTKRDLDPPYLDSVKGGGVPVSALQCGEIWVECDEKSWRKRDRLLKGSPEDRLRDQRETEARAAAYFARHGIKP